ncbi:MAG: recombinase family protein, partial [Phascolarctobacterium sp.]|nr:recombinase family protein [Phascolarctobacterium sp.]
MANIGYVRVSSLSQNTGRQFILFEERGIHLNKTYTEKVSGKNIKDRPQLQEMLKYVREGDTVYLESISRLARNIMDLLKIVEQLQEKHAELVSLKETIDTSTPQGKFLLSIFGAMAQLERDTIKERQREGIDLALAEGRAYGRPEIQISPTFAKNYAEWKQGKIKAIEFMQREGQKKTT